MDKCDLPPKRNGYENQCRWARRKSKRKKAPKNCRYCAAIMNHYNVDAVPHIICGGFSKRETEDALIDLQFLGIDNVLVLRGDVEKG